MSTCTCTRTMTKFMNRQEYTVQKTRRTVQSIQYGLDCAYKYCHFIIPKTQVRHQRPKSKIHDDSGGPSDADTTIVPPEFSCTSSRGLQRGTCSGGDGIRLRRYERGREARGAGHDKCSSSRVGVDIRYLSYQVFFSFPKLT